MRRLRNWLKQDKKDIILVKAVLLALLPVLCCVVRCALDGRTLGEIWLPGSDWNDELFYYKQVEGMIQYGYPLGYYGFNESHALKLSFAAWSPILVFPWILWGLIFGWNLMSPILCNLVLFCLVCFVFVLLVKPTWKQLGILSLLLSLYTPLWRYLLSSMSEVICISMVVLFYGISLSYFSHEKRSRLVILFLLSAVMTLMRPYLILFMLLPAYILVRRDKWKGVFFSTVLMGATLVLYIGINHYLGAEYFTPLFYTDWLKAFPERGFIGGITATCGKLYHMGRSFLSYTIEGFRSGLYSGTFFASFLIMFCVLMGQTMFDIRKHRRSGKKGEQNPLPGRLIVSIHLVFSFAAILLALLLMYKLTEGSRHLLTFLTAGIFLVALMDTKYYKKAAILGVTFAFFFTYMARDPIVYRLPYRQQAQEAQLETWTEIFDRQLTFDKDHVPGFENVMIWVLSDGKETGVQQMTHWQLLYGLPSGYGISCCEASYCMENLDTLRSHYLATLSGGQLDESCCKRGYREIGRDADLVVFDLYSAD